MTQPFNILITRTGCATVRYNYSPVAVDWDGDTSKTVELQYGGSSVGTHQVPAGRIARRNLTAFTRVENGLACNVYSVAEIDAFAADVAADWGALTVQINVPASALVA
jgi:hypothetical protein